MLNIDMNEGFSRLGDNYLFSEIARRVKKYKERYPEKDIISLGIGDSVLPIPKSAEQAMKKAVSEMASADTFKGYPPFCGYDFLKEAVKDDYKSKGIDIKNGEIFIGCGSKSDACDLWKIFGRITAVIPEPVYPVYYDSNIIAGNNVILLPKTEENGFAPTPDALSGKGYIICLCSPDNPSGAVMSRALLEAWINFASATGSIIVYDAAYSDFINDSSPRSIYEIESAERCAVELKSFSKFGSFTGVRCSWIVIPEELREVHKAFTRLRQTEFNGVSYIIQRGAEALLSQKGKEECRDIISYYLRNSKLITDMLELKNINCFGGSSSPYIWLKTPNISSWEFFDKALNEANVVLTPGSGFGEHGEGYVRISSFCRHEDCLEAVKRLNDLL